MQLLLEVLIAYEALCRCQERGRGDGIGEGTGVGGDGGEDTCDADLVRKCRVVPVQWSKSSVKMLH